MEEKNKKKMKMKHSGFTSSLIIILVSISLLAVTGSISVQLLLPGRLYIDIPLHSSIEILGSITALFLAILILLLQKDKKVNNSYIWVSCALISMGILDGFHAFTPQTDYFVWLHSAAILAGGMLFAMVWLPDRFTPSRSYNTLFMIAAISSLLLGVFSAAFPDALPKMVHEDAFTSTAKAINILGGLFFLSATAYFIIRYRRGHTIEDLIFVNFCLINGWGGLLFSFSGLWNLDWWFWHLLRIMAYFIAISYIFITFQREEEALEQHREHLEEIVEKRTADLVIANERLQQEIIEKRSAEEELQRSHVLLNAINNAQSHFISDSEKGKLFDGLLKNLLVLTGSEYGFIGEILYDPKGEPYLKTSALTNIAWNDKTQEFYEMHAPIGMEFSNTNTLFGQVLKTGKPVIANNPSADERKGGLPPGHPQLNSFLGVPFYQGKKLVGMAGIANRQAGYDEDLVEYLKPLLATCANIIEAYRTENQRKKIETEKERYIKAINEATDGIAIADESDRYIYINPAYAAIFGCSQDELLGETWRKIIPPGLIASVENGLSGTMHNKSAGVFNGEVPGLRKDGSIIPAEVTGTGFWDEDGSYRGHVCIVRDITERKQADDKIKQSEEKYRDLFENANDAICILDSDLNYKDVNKKTVEMSGYTKEELLTMNIYDVIPSEQIQRSEIEFNKLRKNGSYEKFVGKVRTKNGYLIDVEVSSSVIKEGGKVIGSRDIIRDITERVRNEEALRESEERYRTIIEHSNDMIWTMDREGRFLFFNKRSEEITGSTLMEWLGKSFTPFIENKDLPKVVEAFNNVLTGQPQQFEVTVRKMDGRIMTLSVNSAPIYSKGKIIGTVNFGRDVTDRKKIEEQIKNSLKEKEVLLREVYHRVKNNMQIITSLLKLQSRYVREGEYREMFKESLNRIKSMSLVHEKLYQSKDLSTIDFKEYIKDIAKGLFQSYGANKGKIALVMDINNISLDINTAIPCGLIINELVTNSLKHAFPEGKEGEIKIAIHSMKEDMIELVVGDNGAGISEDVNFRTTKSLGLQLVTMLAEQQLHGVISLDRNKGTEFTITFKEVK